MTVDGPAHTAVAVGRAPQEMPEWCRHRRAEVFGEIKRLTAGNRIKWVEYGDMAPRPETPPRQLPRSRRSVLRSVWEMTPPVAWTTVVHES